MKHDMIMESPQLLTSRERQVVELLCQGYDNSTIAGHLGISVETVRFFLKRVYSKLAVNSRTQAVIKFLQPPEPAGGHATPRRQEEAMLR